MKKKKIFIVTLLLLAIITMGAASASEDIADDAFEAIEPTDDAVSQSVDEIEPADEIMSEPADDEIYSADDSEDILTATEIFEPEVIHANDELFYPMSRPITVFSVGEKFNIGVRAPGANGTFNVYYAGWNDFGPFKYNNTVLASGNITDGIGITELSFKKAGNPIYPVGYDYLDLWIEYKTNKGNGDLWTDVTIIENDNKHISATVTPEEFVEGDTNTATLKFSSQLEKGVLEYWVDGFGKYTENTKSAEIPIDYLDVGTHNVKVLFRYGDYQDEKYFSKTLTVTVLPWVPTITQLETKITPAKVTVTYNVDKKVTFTLKDEDGKPLAGQKVTVRINKNTLNKVTDSKGQISMGISSLAPNTYSAIIKFAGDESYKASSKTVNIVVKKATPKITAAKKTFKVKAKTKKVTATLKNNKGKPLKKVSLTLKIGKKTYTAKTNKNGVATFKVKLTKKGSFTGTVKYKGSKYYKALSKKVYIKVKK